MIKETSLVGFFFFIPGIRKSQDLIIVKTTFDKLWRFALPVSHHITVYGKLFSVVFAS